MNIPTSLSNLLNLPQERASLLSWAEHTPWRARHPHIRQFNEHNSFSTSCSLEILLSPLDEEGNRGLTQMLTGLFICLLIIYVHLLSTYYVPGSAIKHKTAPANVIRMMNKSDPILLELGDT